MALTNTMDLSNDDWEGLIEWIRNGLCTPFIGAGACTAMLPAAQQLSRELADTYNFPFEDHGNLARVTQYAATMRGTHIPHLAVKRRFENALYRDGADRYQLVHRVLAQLPFPVYITTNYDNLLQQALQDHGRTPETVICEWFNARRGPPEIRNPVPSKDRPVVFHLHGSLDDYRSMVLTEDDRGGSGFSDTGISWISSPGTDRRDEVHEEAKT
jgi:SIR2-like domain